MKRPNVIITMGDPAGVGPETIVGAWSNRSIHEICRPIVAGHPAVMRRAAALLGGQVEVVETKSLDAAAPTVGVLPCMRVTADDAEQVPPAEVDARGGESAFAALSAATEMAKSGEADAIVTAPLNKAALWAAGRRYPGHTEILAELCGVQDVAMALYLGAGEPLVAPHGLLVAHVTLHMSMREALERITFDSIVRTTRLAHDFMLQIKEAPPKLGVAALNPHAGEQGLFGKEEIEVIGPAITAAKASGIDVAGPFPVDTLMHRARDGEFDAVIAMYHDQGHIAVKLMGMHRAVNVALGLPIIRTSVAHGTAFDLAWTGRATTTGMVEAIRVAAQLAQRPNVSRDET